jgi:hypothetical protein
MDIVNIDNIEKYMCNPPRFLPKPMIIKNYDENGWHVVSILWKSTDDGRIYKSCNICNGSVCGRGINRFISKL